MDEPQKISAKRRAELLGVDVNGLETVCERAKRLTIDVHPKEAIKHSVFWYQERAKRRDATSPELLHLMRRYWHCDGVSRATAKSKQQEHQAGVKVQGCSTMLVGRSRSSGQGTRSSSSGATLSWSSVKTSRTLAAHF